MLITTLESCLNNHFFPPENDWITVRDSITTDQFLVTLLQPNSPYQFRVACRNSLGLAEYSVATPIIKTGSTGELSRLALPVGFESLPLSRLALPVGFKLKHSTTLLRLALPVGFMLKHSTTLLRLALPVVF